jgi:hypothetical protein
VLLNMLRWAGADEQFTALASRAAARAALDDPEDVARLLYALRWAGASEQVAALAERVAVRASVHAPSTTRGL